VARLQKETCNFRHPMHLRHPVWTTHTKHGWFVLVWHDSLMRDHRRRRSDLKWWQLPKFQTNFHGSPRTYQTRFQGSPQIFKKRFTWVNGVSFKRSNSGYFPRTWFSCSHMVVETLFYCTRKGGCKGGCMSACFFLQPPRNGSTGQIPVLEYETFSRTVLGTPRTCTRCS